MSRKVEEIKREKKVNMTVGSVILGYKNQKMKPPSKLLDLNHTMDVSLELLKAQKFDEDAIAEIMGSQWWDIRGIGPVMATKLWKEGMRPENIDEWKSKLPIQAQMWLIYKPLSRIPREVIPELVKSFMPEGVKNWQIVGSYRRKKPTVGDVDILYYGKDLNRLLLKLQKKHGSSWYVYAHGDMKIGGMFKYQNLVVEVDIWFTAPEYKDAMELYATGSKMWNIIMRQVAKKRGLKLNQYGLFKPDGTRVPTKSEKDIFDALGMKYKEPEERDR